MIRKSSFEFSKMQGKTGGVIEIGDDYTINKK